MYWADSVASKIVKVRGEKDKYVIASGITPSGPVHVGNFREVFTSWIVGESLRDSGYGVDFLLFWDDYDRFRKVPSGVPREWEEHIGKPVSCVPDPWGCHKSYADHFETFFEDELEKLQIFPVFLYATELYSKGVFADEIKIAVERREEIMGILNEMRKISKTDPLPKDWWPISVYCKSCRRDTTKIIAYDGKVRYSCLCGYEGWARLDGGDVKLKWRVDWPARWHRFCVDFEPGGKDHHTAGGSFDTGKRIVSEIFGGKPPLSVMYEFIGVKGVGGKMSGSEGNVVLISDLLEVMEEGLVRFFIARYRPSREIRLDLGADLLKQYEEYDRQKKGDLERAFVLSKGEPSPGISFSTLVYLVQIPGMNERKILDALRAVGKDFDEGRVRKRIKLARTWVEKYAPEQFIIKIPESVSIAETVREPFRELADFIRESGDLSEETLKEEIFNIQKKYGVPVKLFFEELYAIFIGKRSGPKATTLLLSFDRDFVVKRLRGEA